MRIGYSNLLGEHIAAANVDYGDCQSFQIVCPNCREPLFKVSRLVQAIHYFSHYESSKAYVSECELRVAAGGRHREEADCESRGQRLRFFLGVLQRAILSHEYSVEQQSVAARLLTMKRARALAKLREISFGHWITVSSRAYLCEQFDALADEYIVKDVGAEDPMWKTGFAMATQKRIAKDILLSLCTPPTRENFDFLWNHAYVMLQTRLCAARKIGQSPAPFVRMERDMARLRECSRNEGEQICSALLHTPMFPPHVEEAGFPMLLKLLAEISHEQIGTLLRLPYFEILKGRGNG